MELVFFVGTLYHTCTYTGRSQAPPVTASCHLIINSEFLHTGEEIHLQESKLDYSIPLPISV